MHINEIGGLGNHLRISVTLELTAHDGRDKATAIAARKGMT
jgi:hypothetical protein